MITHLRFYQLVLFFICSTQVLADSAAKTDWVSNNKPNHCQGKYVNKQKDPPQVLSGGNSRLINASAERALHEEGISTTLTGDAIIKKGEQLIGGNSITLDALTENYKIEGNVHFRQNGIFIKGRSGAGNLDKGTTKIETASFVLHANRLRGSARELKADQNKTLTITEGDFTTCEPDSKAWAIRGQKIELINKQGYGTAKHVSIRVKDIPIAYFPYFRFPIDDSRHSGFLWPLISHDGDGGTDIAVPYYFNIKPNLDATYTLRNVWKRGIIHESELRYQNKYSENLIAGTFLQSDSQYDARRTVVPAAGIQFEKQDRWLTHLSHKGKIGRLTSSLIYTSVSDNDYLDDLGGFTTNNSEFGTTMDSSKDPALLRKGRISYTTKSWRSTLELQSFQELNQIKRNQYEMLPRLTIEGFKTLGPVKSSTTLQATLFDNPSKNRPEGSRIVADLSLSMPLRNSWGYMKPELRYVHRNYNLDGTIADLRKKAKINTVLASLDMGMSFQRDTSLWLHQFRQTLEPRLYFLYSEKDSQDDLPNFDSVITTPSYQSLFRQSRYVGYDRIGDAKQMALGVTTRYIDKLKGRELLSLSAGQIFYMEDRVVNGANFSGNNPSNDTSPLFIGINAQTNHLWLRASYEINTVQNHSNRGSVALRYINNHGAIFNFTYSMVDRLQQRTLRNREETDVSFKWPLGKSKAWNVLGRWNYGWDDGQTIESLFGIEYNDCCWTTRVVFRRHLKRPRIIGLSNLAPDSAKTFLIDRRADSGIYFEFQLKGLASLGGRLDNWLNTSIPGYSLGR